MTTDERRLVFGYTTVLQAQHLLEHAMRFFQGRPDGEIVSEALLSVQSAASAILRKVEDVTQYEDEGGDDE